MINDLFYDPTITSKNHLILKSFLSCFQRLLTFFSTYYGMLLMASTSVYLNEKDSGLDIAEKT